MQKSINDTITSLPPSTDRKCVFALLDVSISMLEGSYKSGNSKIEVVAQVLESYVNTLSDQRPNDQLALITFGSEAELLSKPLSVGEDSQKLCELIRSLPALVRGGTSMVTGIKLVQNLIANGRVSELSHVRCIAYSDGHDQNLRSGVAAANELKKSGVHIQTLGIGEKPADVDEDFLRKVATTDADGTHYRFLSDVKSINTTFQALAEGRLVVE